MLADAIELGRLAEDVQAGQPAADVEVKLGRVGDMVERPDKQQTEGADAKAPNQFAAAFKHAAKGPKSGGPAAKGFLASGKSARAPKAKTRQEVQQGKALVKKLRETLDNIENSNLTTTPWKMMKAKEFLENPKTPGVMIEVLEALEDLERGIQEHDEEWPLTDEGFAQLLRLKAAREAMNDVGKKRPRGWTRPPMTEEAAEDLREHFRENPDELKEGLAKLRKKLALDQPEKLAD